MHLSISESKNRKIGLILSYLVFIVKIGVSLFFTPFVLEVLGDREYGLYTFVTSITAWVDTFLLAIVSGYHKFLKEESVRDPDNGEMRASTVFFKIFAVISLIVVALGIGALLLFSQGLIPLDAYTETEKQSIFLIMAGSFALIAASTLLTCFTSYMYYRQKFIYVYTASLVSTIAITLVSYLALINGAGVVTYAFIHFGLTIACSLVTTSVSIFYLKQRIKLKKPAGEEKVLQRNLAKQILIFSSFMILNTVATTLNSNMDSTILGFINPDMVTMNGLAIHLAGYVSSLSTAIGTVFNQRFNNLYFEEDGKKKSNDLFLRVSNYQLLLVFLITGGFLACGKGFVILWLDEAHMDVFYIGLITMIISSVYATTSIATYSRMIQNVHKKAAVISLVGAVANLGISVALVFIMGGEYALWACLIGTVVSTVATQWIAFTIYDSKVTGLPMKRYWLMYIKILLIAGILGGGIFLLFNYAIDLSSLSQIIQFLIKGGSFVILYFIALLIFYRPVVKELFSFVLRKKRKSNHPKELPNGDEGPQE